MVTREMFDSMQNADIISHLTKEFNEVSRMGIRGQCKGFKGNTDCQILITTSFFTVCYLCTRTQEVTPWQQEGHKADVFAMDSVSLYIS